jgi:predicted nucleotidyltransferase
MGIEELLLPFKEEILRIAAKYGAYNLRVFGSVARGEARPDSDIDFLVDLEPGRNLLDRIALIQDLEELLNRKIDVAKPSNLHELIKDKILSEAVPLSDKKILQDLDVLN